VQYPAPLGRLLLLSSEGGEGMGTRVSLVFQGVALVLHWQGVNLRLKAAEERSSACCHMAWTYNGSI